MRDYKKTRYRYNWKEEKWEYYEPFLMKDLTKAVGSFSRSSSFLKHIYLNSTPCQKIKWESIE